MPTLTKTEPKQLTQKVSDCGTEISLYYDNVHIVTLDIGAYYVDITYEMDYNRRVNLLEIDCNGTIINDEPKLDI